ncbi:MAG: hypothetical protein HZA37_01490 [Parcubacteria group bacterium]|nr:hypothetical protein [Parcubacteria group bacterium]
MKRRLLKEKNNNGVTGDIMDAFSKIKFVLKEGCGKCVILDGDDPRYVVMTWAEYEKLVNLVEELKTGKDIDIKNIPL